MADKKIKKDLIKVIEADGWYLARQTGGHMQFKHPTKPGLVTIPNNVKKNIELSVFRQAGIERRKNGM